MTGRSASVRCAGVVGSWPGPASSTQRQRSVAPLNKRTSREIARKLTLRSDLPSRCAPPVLTTDLRVPSPPLRPVVRSPSGAERITPGRGSQRAHWQLCRKAKSGPPRHAFETRGWFFFGGASHTGAMSGARSMASLRSFRPAERLKMSALHSPPVLRMVPPSLSGGVSPPGSSERIVSACPSWGSVGRASVMC